MKAKTSVTLSKDLLMAVDRLAGSKSSRSAVIERAVRSYLKERERALIYAHDLEILNRAADHLNAEAEETLQYQADPWRAEME
jgi:metal-responsive CopG/Arc/MetJ family transcriptional regulator